jgi:glycosyltransferase involved in cell wall biosynthesis
MTRYIIISPVRDEGENIGQTIQSVVQQTVRPTQWILVNDGSSDNTGEIIDLAAKEHPWITALHIANRGFRQPGTGVMATFYHGYDYIATRDWEFIVKLDGDVEMPPDYFEKCFAEFEKDPKLGVGGGVMYCIEPDGTERLETHPAFHVRGPTKIYQRGCWDAMGGLIKAPGWDTADELKANMLGWRSRSFPNIRLIHRRATGAMDGAWRDSVKNGRADFICGYLPAFMIVKCMKRALQRPVLVGAAGHMYGYITGYLKNIPQAPDKALIAYTRQQQMRRLLFQETIWK